MNKPRVRDTFDDWWERDPATGCHVWRRSVAASGYGQLQLTASRPILAHRFAWQRVHGRVPKGMCVLHRCATRVCVNVEHLYIGTREEAGAKAAPSPGPGFAGEYHPRAKLTRAQVVELRGLYATRSLSQRALAKRFGLSQTHVGSIVRGESWKKDQRPDLKPRIRRIAIQERFDDFVRKERTGCWVWTGWLTPDGYGKFNLRGKKTAAHRFSYARAHGSIPAGKVVRHRCDNPACVNPAHLQLGSQTENVRDAIMRRRNRGAAGVRNRHAKLAPRDVSIIRTDYRAGVDRATLAARFGVSTVQIRNIVTGRAWASL